MRILILTENFPPETKSCSTLFYELAESLVQKGHKVSVMTRMPKTNIAVGVDIKGIPAKERMAGIDIHRFQTPPLARNIPIIRGFEQFLLSFILFMGGLFLEKHDIILVYSPPLPLGIAAYYLGKIKGSSVVVNIQDLYPRTVIDLGLLKNKILIWLASEMEGFIYKRSDFITVHSDGNQEYVLSRGAIKNKTSVVHNWVDTELIQPGNKINEFSKKYDLQDKFVISFAGVMGFAQGLEVVIQAANRLKDHKDMVFIFVGDGVKKAELEKSAMSLKLNNVLFISTQPLNIYPQVLHASDICLAVLDKSLVTPVVPGKILSIMAAGKPVLASLALAGDAPKIINQYACGVVVEAGSADLLAEEIKKLYNNTPLREEMGNKGREAALRYFSRSACVSMYEEIFNLVMSRRNA